MLFSLKYALAILLMSGSVASGAVWFIYAQPSNEQTSFIDEYRAEISLYPASYDPIEVSQKYYSLLGPEVMLDVLEENPYCHAKAHNLGRLIYIRNDRDLMKALDVAGQRCTEAAFHGVLMQVLDDIGANPEHVEGSDFAAKAVSFCAEAGVSEHVPRGSCIHGIGHVLMQLVANDTEKAISLCDIFPEKSERYYCATGVFMQREKTIGKEDARISDRYPCDVSDYPAACYRYKLRDVYTRSEWSQAMSVCQKLPKGSERAGCFHGLGFGFYRIVENDPTKVPSLCDSTFALDKQLCLEGIVGAFQQNISDAQAVDMCTMQSEPYAAWCPQALTVGNSGMDRDMDVYYVRVEEARLR